MQCQLVLTGSMLYFAKQVKFDQEKCLLCSCALMKVAAGSEQERFKHHLPENVVPLMDTFLREKLESCLAQLRCAMSWKSGFYWALSWLAGCFPLFVR